MAIILGVTSIIKGKLRSDTGQIEVEPVLHVASFFFGDKFLDDVE